MPDRRSPNIATWATILLTSVLAWSAGGCAGDGRHGRTAGAPVRQEQPPAQRGPHASEGVVPIDSWQQSSAVSTFALDVDTAAYVQARSALRDDRQPASDLRVEEFVNYFAYDYPEPPEDAEVPVSIDCEASDCPWAPGEVLLRIGLRTNALPTAPPAPLGLVLVVDTSGSMGGGDKLALLKQAFAWSLASVREIDRVSLIGYNRQAKLLWRDEGTAGRTGLAEAIHSLDSGGGTNGGDALRLALAEAQHHRSEGRHVAMLLCTDGAFNAGRSDRAELEALLERHRDPGLAFTVLGVGQDAKDVRLEALAGHAAGAYHLVDGVDEARRIITDGLAGGFRPAVRDAKLQVFFNPTVVRYWQLVGYDNRRLAATGFNDDYTGGATLGHGETVTALYRIGLRQARAGVDRNPFYDPQPIATAAAAAGHLAQVRLRTRPVGGGASRLQELRVANELSPLAEASASTRWAAAMAWFALELRHGRRDLAGRLWRLAESATGGRSERLDALELLRGWWEP